MTPPRPAHPALTRRDFLSTLGITGAGLALAGAGVSACGGGGGSTVVEPPSSPTGSITGTVTNLAGVPQPNVGTLILMNGSGRQTGTRVSPDANGKFSIPQLSPGDYQLRFNAPGVAFVPEPYPHPIRCSVLGGKATDVPVRIQLGNYNQNLVEIYIGDGFFQLQPDGTENGEAVVKLGSNVCWYNVDTVVHTVTGGPWGDSGDLQKAQAYLWPATQLGLFSYRCKYHDTQEKALLRVVP